MNVFIRAGCQVGGVMHGGVIPIGLSQYVQTGLMLANYLLLIVVSHGYVKRLVMKHVNGFKGTVNVKMTGKTPVGMIHTHKLN
jgi:hypothetical protein